ncbi:MAG: polysaccharide deacetylase family protein [Bacteroidetes bacterium]|nr:polysaccharide deacetylase family protein [Bacteroidota bacterium]MBS1631112.1 polysaccharide deacetylase family protein [Bacteroidota bacterium]
MKKKRKIPASISLDLDDKWSYMKVHGDAGWETFPSYLDIVLPITLDILDKLDIKITFFIVGQDAAIEKNGPLLRSIAERGHEVANHSFHHESWLKTYSKDKIEEEIRLAEEAILKATGKRTNMFRGPGFSWSSDLLEVLQSRNYVFDASILPTYLSPLMRKYYFWKSKLTKEQKKSRKELFGSFREGFYPLKPFKWKLKNGKSLLEIPVTTMPVFKIPFHQSYLIYISNISSLLMKMYLRFSIFMCKLTKTSPSYLLHPLDLIGSREAPELEFFPGMKMQKEKKIKIFEFALSRLKKNFELLPMGAFAKRLSENRKEIPVK